MLSWQESASTPRSGDVGGGSTLFRTVHVFTPGDGRGAEARQRLEALLEAAGFHVTAETRPVPDLVISLGGDGTFLAAVRRFLDDGPAFLGLNAGHLGFLQEAELSGVEAAVERLRTGRFHVEQAGLVEVETAGPGDTAGRQRHHALNDVVVERRGTRTLRLTLRVDGSPLEAFVADGVLVASPLGSTAYAFAAGGAIVHPGCRVLQVVAINVHRSRLSTAFDAPLILPAGTTIGIEVDWGRARVPRLVVDGEEAPLEPGQEVRVRLSDRHVRVVRFGDLSFWDRLRGKLA